MTISVVSFHVHTFKIHSCCWQDSSTGKKVLATKPKNLEFNPRGERREDAPENSPLTSTQHHETCTSPSKKKKIFLMIALVLGFYILAPQCFLHLLFNKTKSEKEIQVEWNFFCFSNITVRSTTHFPHMLMKNRKASPTKGRSGLQSPTVCTSRRCSRDADH